MLLADSARADEFKQTLDGDIGMGGYYTRSVVRGNSDAFSVLPYADFTYGRAFARVDTFGVKTLPVGYGHLELIARFTQDGLDTTTPALQGLDKRSSSLPLGIGTLQITPVGGFYINAFHDVRQSKGNWLEVIYGAKLELPRVTFYPMLGIDYQTKEYVRYHYGVSAQEAAGSPYAAYQPSGASNPLIALIADFELTEDYHLNAYVRRKRLGDAIALSPIVTQRYMDSGYLTLSYRFR